MDRYSSMVVFALLVAGCGGNDGSVAQKTGKTVGEVVTDFATGVGSGVDKGMEVSVELSENASNLGISKTVSKQPALDKKAIVVYFITTKPVKAQLIAKAVNGDGQEVGRSVADVDFAADDAKHITFEFESEVDMQRVEKYIIDVRQPPAATTPESDAGTEDAEG